MLQSARRQVLPLDVVLDLYQKMVVPVLLYGSEIWGHECLDLIEKPHLKSLKCILHLNRSTMSSQVYGESGNFPVSIMIKARMVRFWADLVGSQGNKLSSSIYSILHELHSRSVYTSPWLSVVRQTLVDAGLECAWETQTFTSKDALCSIVNKSLRDSFIQQWWSDLDGSTKCLFYKNFKSEFSEENFVKDLPDQFVFALIKFRCSNHKLPVEMGRRYGIPREERLCRKCNAGAVGDEFHLVMECAAFKEERQKFTPLKFRRVKSTFYFCNIMSSNSKRVALNLAKFLKATGAV